MALSILPRGVKALLELVCHYAKWSSDKDDKLELVPSLCHMT